MPEQHYPITSLNAIKRTIDRDSDTLRWFTYLLAHPTVRADLRNYPNIGADYKKFRSLLIFQTILGAFLLILYVTLVVYNQLMMTLSVATVLITIFLVRYNIKQSVRRLSHVLIERDFTENDFSQKTLYQIGEFYARRYGTKSLVATIASADTLARRVLFYIWIFGTIINPSSVKEFWILYASGYFVTYALLDAIIVYVKTNASN